MSSADSGTISTWCARYVTMRPGQRFSLSGNLASMANGLPHSIAAQIGYANRQCVAFVGDGGFTMLMGRALRTPSPVLIEALVRGDANGGRIATTIFRDRITDMLAPSGEEHGLFQAIKEKAREMLRIDPAENGNGRHD